MTKCDEVDNNAGKCKYLPTFLSNGNSYKASIRLGLANTRMKDFYDIWLLIQRFSLEKESLFEIIQKVLKNRGTQINEFPKTFTEAFYKNPNKIEKWSGFLKDISHDMIPLEKVILDLKSYFEELLTIPLQKPRA